MSALIPLKQKIEFLWSYNSQVFSPAEPHIRGQLCLSFVRPAEGIVGISYGLCGDYKLEYNNLLKKNGCGVLFDVERDVPLPRNEQPGAFSKGQQIVESFQLSFPETTTLFAEPMPLPTSCLYYGDEQGYDPQLSVKYRLYVKVTHIGGFPKREKTETFTFPLTYQGQATFHSTAESLLYREFGVYPLISPHLQQQGQLHQTSMTKTSKLLGLTKNQDTAGLDLIMELKLPAALDINVPLFPQLGLRFITNYSIGSLGDTNYSFSLEAFKLTVYYYSTFVYKRSTSKYQRKKSMLELKLTDSAFGLRDFKYDQVNSYHYLDYQIREHPAVTINGLVGLHSFLPNCKLFEGRFTNTSCLHLTFKISDDSNNENTFKFRTESSPTAIPRLPDNSKESALQYDFSTNPTDEDTL